MKSNIKKNFIFNLINQIVNLVVPFILTPYLSRALGVSMVGEYSFVFSIVTYFVLLATLGTDLYGQREVSYHQKNKKQYSRVFYEILILRSLLTIFALVIYIIAIVITGASNLYIILMLYIINVAIDITWFYSGLEMFKLICIRNLIVKIFNAILIILLVKVPSDLSIYAFIMSICMIISSVTLWFNLFSIIELKSVGRLNPFKHLKGSAYLFIPTIAITLYTVFDKTMIGMFAPDYSENGYYEQAYKVINIALRVVTALAYVVMPRIAYLKSKNNKKAINEYFYKAANFVWFLSLPIMFGLIAISGIVVPWFFGPGYEGSIIVLKILSVLVPIIGFSNLIGIQYLIPLKKDNIYTMSVVIGAIVNIGFNLLFIPRYYAMGAAFASIIGEMFVTIYQGIHIVKEINFYKVFKLSINYFIGSFIMFIVIFIISLFFTPSLTSSILLVAGGIIFYLLYLVVIKDKFTLTNIMLLFNLK